MTNIEYGTDVTSVGVQLGSGGKEGCEMSMWLFIADNSRTYDTEHMPKFYMCFVDLEGS